MSTIFVSERTKKRLLTVAASLQEKLGKRVSFDDVISYLIDLYERDRGKPELFRLFCKPMPGVSFKEAYEELLRERRKDERRLRGKEGLLA